MTGVSVVLPVYRNAEVLEDLHARLCAALTGEDFELIFVDDACPAGSGTLLESLARRDSRVRVIRHAANQGQRIAVWHGLQAAGGAIAVTMDADLQDPPEAIPLMIAALRASPECAIYAARRGEYQGRLRMATSFCYRKALHTLTGLPADVGGYLAISRAALDRILPAKTPAPYLPALLAGAGVPLRGIPVERPLRPAGESAYSEWARLRVAWRSITEAWRLKRRT